jgi:hypothetical protein
VYQEQEPAAEHFEFMPTSVPAPGEIEIPREPELLESAADATRSTVAEDTEPGLLSTGQQFEAPSTSAAELAPLEEEFVPAGFQDIPAEIAAHLPSPSVEAPIAPPGEAVPVAPPPMEQPAAGAVSDSDFEARVAAALAAYAQAQDAPVPPGPAATDSVQNPPTIVPEAVQEVVRHEPEPTLATSEAVPALVEQEQIVAVEAPVVDDPTASVAPELALPDEPAGVTELPVPSFEYHPPVQAAPETPLPAVEESVAPGVTSFASVASQVEAESAAVVEAPVAPEVPAVVAPAASVPPAFDPPASQPPIAEALPTHNAHQPPAAAIDNASPAAAMAAAAAAAVAGSTNADHHTISQAVHRVMERLKPELVDEILRELKSKKD